MSSKRSVDILFAGLFNCLLLRLNLLSTLSIISSVSSSSLSGSDEEDDLDDILEMARIFRVVDATPLSFVWIVYSSLLFGLIIIRLPLSLLSSSSSSDESETESSLSRRFGTGFAAVYGCFNAYLSLKNLYFRKSIVVPSSS